MPLWRRRPLHEELAREGGLLDALRPDRAPVPAPAAQVPGWDGAQRGEPGIHGVPRARRFDAVVTARVPGLSGDTVHFVVLEDESIVASEDEPDEALRALLSAIGTSVSPTYRAEAVRREGDTWAVAASRIRVVKVPGLRGDHAELVVAPSGWTLTVDGTTSLRRVPALEAVGSEAGPEYVVRGTRLDGELWEVEVAPL